MTNDPAFIIESQTLTPITPGTPSVRVHRLAAKSEELPWFNSVDPLHPTPSTVPGLASLAALLWLDVYRLGTPRSGLQLVAPSQCWIGHVFLEDLLAKDEAPRRYRVHDDPDGVIPWAAFGHASFVAGVGRRPAFWFWFTMPALGEPCVQVFTTLACGRILEALETANGAPIRFDELETRTVDPFAN